MTNYEVIVTEETGEEIITVAECKNFIRIDTSADDTLLGIMITAARKNAENFLGRDIVAKNRTMWVGLFEDFIDQRIELLFGPIDEVSDVTLSDSTALTFEVFGIKDKSVKLNQIAQNFTINYSTTGMNDSLLKQALLQIVSTYYDNRTDFVTGMTMNELPNSAAVILNGYKYLYF